MAPGHPANGASPRLGALLLVAALAVAALPLTCIVRGLPAAQRTDYSVGDLAAIEIGVIEALHGERLLGQPTRLGLHQLGPSHFYLQVPLYKAFGRERFALSLTCVLLNWACLMGVLWLCARHFESELAAIVLVCSLVPFLGYYEPATLFNYWGQYLIVLPTMLFLASAAAAASGRARPWPLVVALASFIVQGYGSSLIPVAGVVAASLGLAVWRHRTSEPGALKPWRRRDVALQIGACVLVAALFWVGPALEQMRNSPGNLRLLWNYSRQTHAAPAAAVVGASFAKHLASPWLWVFWKATVNTVLPPARAAIAEILAAAEIALLAACGAIAWRRRQTYGASLCILCLLSVAGAAAAVRALDGELYSYIFFWLSACGLLGWVAIGSVLLQPLSGALSRRIQGFRGVHRELAALVAAVVLAAFVAFRPIVAARLGDANVGPLRDALAEALAQRADRDGPVHLVSHDLAWPWSLALLIQLDRRGYPVTIENVQGETRVDDLQGLSPVWTRDTVPASRVHVFDRDPGAESGLARLICHPVLPLIPNRPEICLYAESFSAGTRSRNGL